MFDFFILVVLAAIVGGIGNSIAGGSRNGCLTSTALGFVGALIGTWIAKQLNLPDIFSKSLDVGSFPIVYGIMGAALFVAVLNLIAGRK